MNEMYIFWGAAIIVLITIELLTVQLVTVWFALGALCAFFAVMAGAPFWLQLIVFVAVSLIALIATRPLVKKFMVRNIQPTNADRCIGQQALAGPDHRRRLVRAFKRRQTDHRRDNGYNRRDPRCKINCFRFGKSE